jgi:hypothetical protein
MLKTNTIIVDVIEGCILPNYVLCVIGVEEIMLNQLINLTFIINLSFLFNPRTNIVKIFTKQNKTNSIRVSFQYNIYKLRKQKITKLLDNEKI